MPYPRRNGTRTIARERDSHTPIEATREPLLEQVVAGERNAIELAEHNGWSLVQIARWMTHPGNRAVLSQLAALEDARAHLLLSRYRATAAIQLAAIACSAEPNETSRKACTDLLQLGLDITPGTPGGSSDAPSSMPTGSVPSPEAILATLESLGSDPKQQEQQQQEEESKDAIA